MRRFAFTAIVPLCFSVLGLSMLGCKPDAALHNGEMIDAGPSAPNNKQDQPIVIKPKTDKDSPVKQVQ